MKNKYFRITILLLVFIMSFMMVSEASSHQEKIKITIVENAQGKVSDVIVKEPGNGQKIAESVRAVTHDIPVPNGKYNLHVTADDTSIEDILVFNISTTSSNTTVPQLVIEEYNTTDYYAFYAVDPTQLNTSVNITRQAKGTVLSKCANWSMTNQTCLGEWVFYNYINPNENYTLTLDPYDPAFIESGEVADVSMGPINNTAFVIAWVDIVNTDLVYAIYNTNGNVIVNNVIIDSTVDVQSRVDVSMINSTHFVIGWIDGVSDRAMFMIRNVNQNAGSPLTPIQVDVGLLNNLDISVAQLGDRFVVCYVDDTLNDASYRTYLNSGSAVGGEIVVDSEINPLATLQNQISCKGITNNRFTYLFFDGFDNDVTFNIRNSTFGNIFGPTDLDTTAGPFSQVSAAVLNSNRWFALWYDAPVQELFYAIRDQNGTAIKAPTSLSVNPGNEVRVSSAYVKARYNSSQFYYPVWFSQTGNQLQTRILDSNGNILSGRLVLDNNPDVSFKINDIISADHITGNSLCPGRFVVAFTNASDKGVFKTFYDNGAPWNGQVCDNTRPSVTALSAVPSPQADGLPVNLTANVIDTLLSTVLIRVTLPNFSTQEFTMSPIGGNNFRTTFTDTTQTGTYTFRIIANDTEFNVNNTQTSQFIIQGIPPSTVTLLTAIAIGQDYIAWSWVNPTEPDFSHVIVYIDGINVANTSGTTYNATGFLISTTHTITLNTVDNAGNVNTTDISDTRTTLSALQSSGFCDDVFGGISKFVLFLPLVFLIFVLIITVALFKNGIAESEDISSQFRVVAITLVSVFLIMGAGILLFASLC